MNAYSNKLDFERIIERGEVCAVCLRLLAPRASDEPHICINCERTARLSRKLENVFGDITRGNTATNATLVRICKVRNSGETRIANCPLCGARCEVRGHISPQVTCKHCKITFSQFNGKIIATDILLNCDLPYASDAWRPVFEREEKRDANISNLLEQLRRLNL